MGTDLVALIVSLLTLIVLAIKIGSDVKKSNKEPENEETTVTGNPHYCLHQEEWGRIKEAIENFDEKFKKIDKRFDKIDAKLNSK